jgi:hypothetical protein
MTTFAANLQILACSRKTKQAGDQTLSVSYISYLLILRSVSMVSKVRAPGVASVAHQIGFKKG